MKKEVESDLTQKLQEGDIWYKIIIVTPYNSLVYLFGFFLVTVAATVSL